MTGLIQRSSDVTQRDVNLTHAASAAARSSGIDHAMRIALIHGSSESAQPVAVDLSRDKFSKSLFLRERLARYGVEKQVSLNPQLHTSSSFGPFPATARERGKPAEVQR